MNSITSTEGSHLNLHGIYKMFKVFEHLLLKSFMYILRILYETFLKFH